MFQKIANSYKERKESKDWRMAMLSRQSLKTNCQEENNSIIVVEQNETNPRLSFAL